MIYPSPPLPSHPFFPFYYPTDIYTPLTHVQTHMHTCTHYSMQFIDHSEELQELRAQIEHQKKVEERLRLDHATQSYQYEKLTGEKGYEDRSHAQEKAVLYAEMKKLKGEIEKNNDMSILHKRQMQAMKQAMAENEKTKLKLRAAEMKADDAADELRTLRQRAHELEERVVTLESDTVYDKMSAEMEALKDEADAELRAKEELQNQVAASARELEELAEHQVGSQRRSPIFPPWIMHPLSYTYTPYTPLTISSPTYIPSHSSLPLISSPTLSHSNSYPHTSPFYHFDTISEQNDGTHC